MAFWPSCSRIVLPVLHNLSTNSMECLGQTSLKTVRKHFLCTVSKGTIIFDREAKRIQRNRAAQLDDYSVCQYVKVSYLIPIFTYICIFHELILSIITNLHPHICRPLERV